MALDGSTGSSSVHCLIAVDMGVARGLAGARVLELAAAAAGRLRGAERG